MSSILATYVALLTAVMIGEYTYLQNDEEKQFCCGNILNLHQFMNIEEEAKYEQQALFKKFTKKNDATLDAVLDQFNFSNIENKDEYVIVVSVGSSSTQFYNRAGTVIGGAYAGTEAMKTNPELIDSVFATIISKLNGNDPSDYVLLFCNSIAFLLAEIEYNDSMKLNAVGNINNTVLNRFRSNTLNHNFTGIVLNRNQYKFKNDWTQLMVSKDAAKYSKDDTLFFVAEIGGGGPVLNYYDYETEELIELGKNRCLLGKQAEFVQQMADPSLTADNGYICKIRNTIQTEIAKYIREKNIPYDGKKIVCKIYQTGQLREFYVTN